MNSGHDIFRQTVAKQLPTATYSDKVPGEDDRFDQSEGMTSVDFVRADEFVTAGS